MLRTESATPSAQLNESFQRNFARQRAVIVNVSGGHQDEDSVVAKGHGNLAEKRVRLPGMTSLRTVHRVTADFSGPPSPGMALRTILAAADLLRARACAVVSPAATNLTPDWIANLLRPVYREKFDFVAPLYTRHKFQGLLARNLLYPMSRALFGCGIRELYSDEWGFSGRLAALCLNQDVWHEEADSSTTGSMDGDLRDFFRFSLLPNLSRSKNRNQQQTPERTLSKSFGRPWEICSGAWKPSNRRGWMARERNPCRRLARTTSSLRSRPTWIDTESSRCSEAE